jgi:hypothetical protein
MTAYRFQDNSGRDPLPILQIVHTHDDGFCYLGMFQNLPFDVEGRDLEASGFEDCWDTLIPTGQFRAYIIMSSTYYRWISGP